MSIENEAAGAILQRPQEVIVDGVSYKVAPPTPATIILASEAISRMPYIAPQPQNVIVEVLRTAKDCRVVGEIAAILILGEKGIEVPEYRVETSLFGLIRRRVCKNRKTELAKSLLSTMTNKELADLIGMLLGTSEVSDFFGLTASLAEINLLKPTKEAVETTASGQ